jgi:hypothetical protein
METHQFTSHSRAVQFLRMKGFTSWPSSPNYWLKKDESSNLYGDIEERAKGVVRVIIHPGSAFLAIVEGRQRQQERSAQIGTVETLGVSS